jgi:hypothetical protein
VASPEEIRRQLEGTVRFRMLSKEERQAFDQSIASVTDGERLLAYGTVRTIEAAGLKIEKYTYYFATERGLYFGGSVKTGFMKHEARSGFIGADEVASGTVKGPYGSGVDMGFLECIDSRGNKVLWMSFDDIAGNVAPPIGLAHQVGEALGLTFS